MGIRYPEEYDEGVSIPEEQRNRRNEIVKKRLTLTEHELQSLGEGGGVHALQEMRADVMVVEGVAGARCVLVGRWVVGWGWGHLVGLV